MENLPLERASYMDSSVWRADGGLKVRQEGKITRSSSARPSGEKDRGAARFVGGGFSLSTQIITLP